MHIELVNSSGDPRVDRTLRAQIGLCQLAFPGAIRGYFITGSYARGQALPNSDVDLDVVFTADLPVSEREKVAQFAFHCYSLDPEKGGFAPRYEPIHSPLDIVSFGQALYIYGEDIRGTLPTLTIDEYIDSVVHQGLVNIHRKLRPEAAHLRYPLDFPDPADAYGGYFRGRTKDLVQTVFWAAAGLVALQTRQFVHNRHHLLELYHRDMADEWTPLLQELIQLCRNQWRYQIPPGADDRRYLVRLCRRAREFENYYLSQYRAYLLEQLRSPDRNRQWAALERLAIIAYPDAEIRDLLQGLADSPSTAMAESARAALALTRQSPPDTGP